MRKYSLRLAISLIFLVAFISTAPVLGQDKGKDTKDKKSEEKLRQDKKVNKDNKCVTLQTSYGDLTLELYHHIAPAHADSFLARTKDGFYSQTTFHRIVAGFMVQGGNGQISGKKPIKYFLPDETSKLPHKEGTLSMASRGAPTTAQTQFFIVFDRNQSAQSLDTKYTVFGQLLRGFEALHEIENLKVQRSKLMGGEYSEPVETLKLIKAYESDEFGNPLK